MQSQYFRLYLGSMNMNKKAKALTMKDAEIRQFKFLIENHEKLHQQTALFLLRLIKKFEHSQKFLLNDEELLTYINSELILTRNLLTEVDKTQLSQILELEVEDLKVILDDIKSSDDETVEMFYERFLTIEYDMTEEQVEFVSNTMIDNPANNRDMENYLTNSVISIRSKRLYFEFLKEELQKVKSNGVLEGTTSVQAMPIAEWKRGNADFYKLVYAMYHSKTIDIGNKDLTKVVEELAGILGIALAKSWESAKTKAFSYTNAGHDKFQLFEDFTSSLSEYIDKQDNKKKR